MSHRLPTLLKIIGILIVLAFASLGVSDTLISYVTGFVYDPNGNPVADVDLDFDDAVTGERVPTPGDNTDQDGYYAIWVPNGVYNISYGPPPGTNLLGHRRFNDSIYVDRRIDVTLGFGKIIHGVVIGNGSPVLGVDLDADNLSTGERIYTPNDKTDSLGNYWIVVPQGNYRLRYQPPAGTRWLGMQMDSLSIYADTVIDVSLSEGMLLSGYVTDELGQGLENISIDLRAMITGEKIYLTNNETDMIGYHNVAVPAGMYRLRYEPPLGSPYVGVVLDSFVVDADIARNQILEAGWLLSTFVHDSTGNPIAGADLDIIQESTGAKLFTPNDETDSMGVTTIAIPADIYTIRVQPPPGSIYDRLVLNGVTIFADTSMDFLLPEVPKVNISGRIINTDSAGLVDIEINFSDTVAGSKIYVADNITDSLGNYSILVPIGGFNAEIEPLRGSRYVGENLGKVFIDQDSTWNDIILKEGYIFSALVLDPRGSPVEAADFDFVLESSGSTIFTPHDNTDIDGTADITVHSGVYTIEVTPPVGTALDNQLLPGFNISSDSSVTILLTEGGSAPPISFILNDNFPNPFNAGTMISYVLFVQTDVSFIIYNSLGQRVKKIDKGIKSPGYHTISWDGDNGRGEQVASGLYFYQLKTSKGSSTHNMLLVR
ncbi:MAG: FlgD immunoglobulin-like domain containing protein [candidate division Zixibacteria bacterium]